MEAVQYFVSITRGHSRVAWEGDWSTLYGLIDLVKDDW
jgi:hypothetical protein